MEAKKEREGGAHDIQLLPDEAQTASLFLALATQWRRCAMSGAMLGLDYGVVSATASMLEIDMGPARFIDLNHMERAAINQFAATAKRGRTR